MEVSQEMIKMQIENKYSWFLKMIIIELELSSTSRRPSHSGSRTVYKEKIRHNSRINKIFWLKTLKYGLKYSAFCFIVLIFSEARHLMSEVRF